MGPTVGWNSLLIELSWPKLCSNGSRKGWIRLWPAGLNWHFRAETDLVNFQSMKGRAWKVERGSTFTFRRALSYIGSILLRTWNLRAYARKNYAKVEIHLMVICGRLFCRTFKPSPRSAFQQDRRISRTFCVVNTTRELDKKRRGRWKQEVKQQH